MVLTAGRLVEEGRRASQVASYAAGTRGMSLRNGVQPRTFEASSTSYGLSRVCGQNQGVPTLARRGWRKESRREGQSE